MIFCIAKLREGALIHVSESTFVVSKNEVGLLIVGIDLQLALTDLGWGGMAVRQQTLASCKESAAMAPTPVCECATPYWLCFIGDCIARNPLATRFANSLSVYQRNIILHVT